MRFSANQRRDDDLQAAPKTIPNVQYTYIFILVLCLGMARGCEPHHRQHNELSSSRGKVQRWWPAGAKRPPHSACARWNEYDTSYNQNQDYYREKKRRRRRKTRRARKAYKHYYDKQSHWQNEEEAAHVQAAADNFELDG